MACVGLLCFKLLICFVIIFYYCNANNSPPQDPSKYKTSNLRLNKQAKRSDFKQKLKKVEAEYLPKYEDKHKLSPPSFSSEGKVVVEFFARKITTGLWARFEDCLGDDSLSNLLNEIKNLSGIEEELCHERKEARIAAILLGQGMGGEATLMSKVKSILPQLRKLKPKDFEFGYKIWDVDGYEEDAVVTLSKLLGKKRRLTIQPVVETVMIDVDLIIDEIKSSKVAPQIIPSTIIDLVDDFSRRVILFEANNLLLFSDGSATLTAKGCQAASSGLCIIPCSDNSPMVEESLCFHVHNAAGVVKTPFDAELLAGLVAACFANAFSYKYAKSIERQGATPLVQNESIHAAGRHVDSPASSCFNVTLISDSKTLCRAFRTGPAEDLAR